MKLYNKMLVFKFRNTLAQYNKDFALRGLGNNIAQTVTCKPYTKIVINMK